ncbi:DNA methyltransferase [Pendulispora albinea]|uniref:site-specific DNA-methyltransferase (adenine-specific) n=1 Tax=Pendulispora albinea TaxID=2741071 RepID=A0ABZ2M146_9BACT
MKKIVLGDNAEVLPTLPEGFARLIYIDPPFNTGEPQKRDRIRVVATDGAGDRGGFGGRRYAVSKIESGWYADDFGDFEAFLMQRIELSLRCLAPNGSIFVHLDYREVHYIKVALDRLLGRKSFKNEIIWAYDFGGRPRNRWPSKHDTILWYTKNPDDYVFHFDEMDRIPYMAPGLVSKEKAERGKTPTDVWWHTIVPTAGREKTGYPTQKPLGVLNRIIKVHSSPGDIVLDFFAGSGTTAEAAARHDRGFVLVDSNPEAVQIAAARLAVYEPECVGFSVPVPAAGGAATVSSDAALAEAVAVAAAVSGDTALAEVAGDAALSDDATLTEPPIDATAASDDATVAKTPVDVPVASDDMTGAKTPIDATAASDDMTGAKTPIDATAASDDATVAETPLDAAPLSEEAIVAETPAPISEDAAAPIPACPKARLAAEAWTSGAAADDSVISRPDPES